VTSSSSSDSSAHPIESLSGEQRSGSPTFRVVVLGVLVVALLAASGTLIWLLAGRRGEAEDVQQQREAVMAQTDQFMLRMGTYGPSMLDDHGQMPTYRSRVKAVITPKFATSFEQQAGTAEQLVQQAGVSRKAEIFSTAVSTIDSDSASALVAGSFTDTYKKGGQQAPVPFRIEVSLVRTDGTWLVDDFTPVTGEGQ
jgi:Mce-associated membrane protein